MLAQYMAADLSRQTRSLELALQNMCKEAQLGFHVCLEMMQHPSIMCMSFDLVFRVKTTINEVEAEADGQLPFKTRLKALLLALVQGLPQIFPGPRWEVPSENWTNIVPLCTELSIANIEANTMFNALTEALRGNVHTSISSCRFRIRATETMEEVLVREGLLLSK